MNYRRVNDREIEYRSPSGAIKRACSYHEFGPVLSNPFRERCKACGFERSVDWTDAADNTGDF